MVVVGGQEELGQVTREALEILARANALDHFELAWQQLRLAEDLARGCNLLQVLGSVSTASWAMSFIFGALTQAHSEGKITLEQMVDVGDRVIEWHSDRLSQISEAYIQSCIPK